MAWRVQKQKKPTNMVAQLNQANPLYYINGQTKNENRTDS